MAQWSIQRIDGGPQHDTSTDETPRPLQHSDGPIPKSPLGATLRQLAQHAASTVNLRLELMKPHCRLWIAYEEAGTSPAAFLMAWEVPPELQVLDLATFPEFRRRGAARALLRTAIEYGSMRALSSLWLELRTSNSAALALYRQCGMEQARRRKKYYSDGEDALEMMLELCPSDPPA